MSIDAEMQRHLIIPVEEILPVRVGPTVTMVPIPPMIKPRYTYHSTMRKDATITDRYRQLVQMEADSRSILGPTE